MTRNLFVELLQESGCNVQGQPTFSTEPILFRRNLSLRIRGDPRSQEILEEFFESLNNHMTDIQKFRQCLLPAKLSGDIGAPCRVNTIESLIKTLLAIDILQPKLMTYLLERLPEFYDELENDASSSCTARLILNQLRWLEYIVEPQELTGKLIEIIEATPTVLQHEIIVSLPDIVNDSEQKPIVVFLKELMSENAELTVPILDTLSNLAMHSEISDEFRQTILDRLVSAELDELPVLVKFLLQTVNTMSIDEVIYGIREKLDFQSLETSLEKQDSGEKNAPEALILESIKLGLQFHKFVCDAWVKSITALEETEAHKVIDVLVLIVLHSMTSMKKKAEQIFRKKVISGFITPELVQDSILQHANGLSAYWNTILSLTESLLRTCKQNGAAAPCSRALYICMFKAGDAYLRQEIVGSLVTHIGSGSQQEIDIALSVLYDLAEDNVQSMAVYGVFIKGILDYLDNLTLPQIRTLFAVFSILALGAENGSESTSLWSDIQIVIRKQLSNPREKYKNMGIMGCLAGVKVLGNPMFIIENENGQGSSAQRSKQREYTADDALRHPMLQQAIGLLEMILRNCSSIPRCMALLYDELAYMIANEALDERLQLWIKENMTSSFTDTYVEDREEALQIVDSAARNAELSIKPCIAMHLDGEEGPIVLKLYSLFSGVDNVKRKLLASPLCAMFNLLQACEKKLNDGSLEDIDALLGCGLMLYSDDNPNELRTSEQQDVCDLLFYAINWLRELLNAFSVGGEEEMRDKLTIRLKNILSLEAKLENVLKHMSRYVPLELQQISPFITDTRNLSIQDLSTNDGSSEGDLKADTHETAKGIAVESISDLRSYMRALNLDVLSILRPSDETDGAPDAEKLNYDDIIYLLQDLNNKLDLKIVPAATNFFGKKKAVNEYKNAHTIASLARMSTGEFLQETLQYLPNIFGILEKAYEDMQIQDTQGGRIPEGAEGLVNCVSLIFEILQKIVYWPEFKKNGNDLILSILVGSIANRITADDSQGQPFRKLLQDAFQYIYRYSDMMPTATMAVMHFKILVRLRSFSNEPEPLRKNTQAIAARIISTDWFDWRNIKKEIPYLLEQSIELHDYPLETLHDYVNRILPLYETEDQVEGHPLLRSDTVLYYYQAMINQAIKAIAILKETDDDNVDVVLAKTGKIVNIFERLTSYIKSKDQRSLFGVLLKNGRLFVDQFSKHSIPYFNKVFKTHKDVVVSIFKDFQTSTRMLQIICSHVKVIKDTQLATYVPPLKKAMETVIFDVKMLLSQNNAPSDAFFLGALKHRDLRGQEVSSQIPREYPSDSGSEDQDDVASVSSSASRSRSSSSSKNQRKQTSRQKHTRGEMVVRTGPSVQDQEENEDEEDEETAAKEDQLFLEAAEEDDEEDQLDKDDDDNESMQIVLDSDDDDQPIRVKRTAASFLRIRDDYEDENDKEEEEEQQRPPTSKSFEAPKLKRRRLGLGRPPIPKSAKIFNLNQDDLS